MPGKTIERKSRIIHQQFIRIPVFLVARSSSVPDIPGNTPLSGRYGGQEKRGDETSISSQNARFAKRSIFRKTRKTPGFNPGHIRCPFSQSGSN